VHANDHDINYTKIIKAHGIHSGYFTSKQQWWTHYNG